MRNEILESWKELNRIALEIVTELVERYYYYADEYIDPATLDRIIVDIVEEMNEKYNDGDTYIDADMYEGVIEIVRGISKGQVFIRIFVDGAGFDKEYGVYLFYNNSDKYSGIELTFNKLDNSVIELVENIDKFMSKHIVGESGLT